MAIPALARAMPIVRASVAPKVRVFPGEASLLRLVSVVLVAIDEKWASETKAYIK